MNPNLAEPFPLLGHVAVEGWSDIANGFIHPFFNPAQVLVLLGLALLLGRQVPLKVQNPLIALAASSALALVLTLKGFSIGAPVPVLTGIAFCIGLLIALGYNLPSWLILSLSVASGIAIGLDSGVETKESIVIAKSITGTWISINLTVLYLALASSNATGKPWAVTGVRIVGSWIVAISLLVLAFALRGKGA